MPSIQYSLLSSFDVARLVHLLKLVTGVEISTRLVRRVGKDGKTANSRRRTAAAEPNSSAFCLSMFIGSSLRNNTVQLTHTGNALREGSGNVPRQDSALLAPVIAVLLQSTT